MSTKKQTTLEQILQEHIAAAFPDGDAPPGLLAMLTGQASVNDAVFAQVQRIERECSEESARLRETLRNVERCTAQAERDFAPSRSWLEQNRADIEGEGVNVMGKHILRELCYTRIMADIARMGDGVAEREAYVIARSRALGPLLELLHIRAGIRPHNAGLAAKLGVTLDELMTPRERQKLEAERRAEDERAAHKAAQDEQNALLYEQQEREREAARQREEAEAEQVESLSPVQWFNMVFENCEPLPCVVRTMDKRADANERAAALAALWDRQSWGNRSLAQRRAARLLHDHIAGVPRR